MPMAPIPKSITHIPTHQDLPLMVRRLMDYIRRSLLSDLQANSFLGTKWMTP